MRFLGGCSIAARLFALWGYYLIQYLLYFIYLTFYVLSSKAICLFVCSCAALTPEFPLWESIRDILSLKSQILTRGETKLKMG